MISKLINGIKEKNAPVVVGLDPQLSFVPEQILNKYYKEMGYTLEAVAEAIYEYNVGIMDACADLIPAVKPQVAMYEQFGVPGVAAYKKTVDYAHKKGLVVIGDIKRGDIGSTSGAYAMGHIGAVEIGDKKILPFDEDIVTVNPYLGSDGVKPFIDVCNENDRGIFVLVKTSNPSSGEFQDRIISDDSRPLYEIVADKVNEWGLTSMDGDYSNVGAVVGATYPEMGITLRKLMPKAYILVPGYGAQGGSGKDLKGFFNEDGLGAIVNSSRGIIAAYKNEKYASFGAEGYADASRAAVEDMLTDIRENI
ncbi:MAG: orotidine-5'-phosphate decarboxylase [Eubacterium sp.]|nr:orotidine-5'-phosphate decarboxylase [Eubacterium sp.]